MYRHIPTWLVFALLFAPGCSSSSEDAGGSDTGTEDDVEDSDTGGEGCIEEGGNIVTMLFDNGAKIGDWNLADEPGTIVLIDGGFDIDLDTGGRTCRVEFAPAPGAPPVALTDGTAVVVSGHRAEGVESPTCTWVEVSDPDGLTLWRGASCLPPSGWFELVSTATSTCRAPCSYNPASDVTVDYFDVMVSDLDVQVASGQWTQAAASDGRHFVVANQRSSRRRFGNECGMMAGSQVLLVAVYEALVAE